MNRIETDFKEIKDYEDISSYHYIMLIRNLLEILDKENSNNEGNKRKSDK